MTWYFYSKLGKLQYDLVASSLGDADTLDGLDSTAFVLKAADTGIGDHTYSGYLFLPTTTVSVDTTLDAVPSPKERTVLVDTGIGSGADITITLPSTANPGQTYEIKDAGNNGSGNAFNRNVIVDRNGSLIDGVASDRVLSIDGESVTLIYSGSQWLTISALVPIGSSIDADTLDGLDSLSFLRKDVADTAAEPITFAKAIYSPITSTPITTDTTLTGDERTILVDSSGVVTDLTVELPLTPTTGQLFVIKDVGNDGSGASDVKPIIIDPNGSDIDGSGPITLDVKGDAYTLEYSGSGWRVITRLKPDTTISTPVSGLSDVSGVGSPSVGQLFRVNNTSDGWTKTTDTIVDPSDDLRMQSAAAQIVMGENAGIGEEVLIQFLSNKVLGLGPKVRFTGGVRSTVLPLEDSVAPVVASSYTANPIQNHVLAVKTSSGSIEIVLPDSDGIEGDTLIIKDIDGDAVANPITVTCEGVQTIDGQLDYLIDTPYQAVTVVKISGNWFII